MFRAVSKFIKSPTQSFPALAAVIGCLVSGYSTFNGISEIFPNFGYSLLAAFGLAVIIQMGMVTSVLGFRDQVQYRPALGFIIVFTVLMSSFTSYVFYYRGYSEETIAKQRTTERWESLRGYLGDARGQTAAALGTLQEAAAELQKRIEIEEGSGGGLRNLSNPYLQKLVAESDVDINLNDVRGGQGERFKFLSSVLPRIRQMEGELSTSLDQIDAGLAQLTDEAALDQASLRGIYANVSASIPVDRIREVRGEFTTFEVDAALLDTSPLEEEEYWQRAVNELVAARSPSAIVFAAIAVFIDLMIVFFAFIAGESESQPVGPRYSMRHWLELAYGPRIAEAAARWLEAMDGDTYTRGGKAFHRIDLHTLAEPRDGQCQSFLRQDGYLCQIALDHGRAPWCLQDSGYWELVDFVRATGGFGERAVPEGADAGILAGGGGFGNAGEAGFTDAGEAEQAAPSA